LCSRCLVGDEGGVEYSSSNTMFGALLFCSQVASDTLGTFTQSVKPVSPGADEKDGKDGSDVAAGITAKLG